MSNSFVLVLNDTTLDKMADAYRAEERRWKWQRRSVEGKPYDRYEIVRFDDIDSRTAQITRVESMTHHECKDHHEADGWRNTFAGRAAVMAAMQAGHDNG